ncbi:MAG: sugar phosphate isomerase/epimerase [Bryobacterales bacterium]|nr:sugar phosphate isomerase/epimerase [Bryobacterales bacterium]MBV9400626.1 sugar phosphate isomerase/epimerase [Bryobacterales bacterium]
MRAAGKRIPLGGNVILPGATAVSTLDGQIGYREIDDPVVLAQEHKRLGYTAAFCPEARPGDTARVNAIRKAFADVDVLIAEVGAWRNMMTPDPGAKKANLEYVMQRLALADELGVKCCVDIAGSFDGNTLSGPHPKNLSKEFFDGTVENCRKILDTVRPKVAKFSIEMKAWDIPDGPDSYLELIRAIDRTTFGVHIDICNIISSPIRYYNNTALIHETFQKLGRWVLSCHAKDLRWVPQVNVNFEEVPPGDGGIPGQGGGVDYHAYLTEVAKLGVPLMLEHFNTNEEFLRGARYIRSVAGKLGLSI